jgi:hypothetical protein
LGAYTAASRQGTSDSGLHRLSMKVKATVAKILLITAAPRTPGVIRK